MYGGQVSTDPLQTENTWHNYFWSLDLSSNFDIASPPVVGLPIPSGPPAVANGFLWSDFDSLYLYGGLYSWKPPANPDPFSLWQYSISQQSWTQPHTQIGGGAGSVQRAAEGAGVSIPHKGIGYYFSGHLDGYTTNGWSQSIPRLYLNSMIEFNMQTKQWTNRTVSDDAAGFPKRADGVLLYVPWGDSGMLVSLAGGTNQTFNQLNIVDIYDIKTSTWSKQVTSGPTPNVRVDPCAVVFSASDQSSHNIYMFAGQNLTPFGKQTQYSDTWILTIPSFTWIKVDDSNQPVPLPRAGHTCNAYRGQMVVVGGYLGDEVSCDSPGVYVFDATKLQWRTGFEGGSSDAGNLDISDIGYGVPDAVISVVGGDSKGGATVTTPQRSPDPSSPLGTSNPDYTYNPNTTEGVGGHTSSISTNIPASTNNSSTTSIGAIVGGVIGGILVIVAALLGFMYLFYRRRIQQMREDMREAQQAHEIALKNRESTSTLLYRSSAELDGDLMNGVEPSFWGMILQPRAALRVVNR